MRRVFVFLFALALLVLFSAPAFAADVKFSGQYYIRGWYVKNHSLTDKDSATGSAYRGSSAFYNTRLRLNMDFEVAKGLKLGSRFDALERKWMAARAAAPTSTQYTTTASEQENIGFEMAYVDFATPIGQWTVGTFPEVQFGTGFGDGVAMPDSAIRWAMPVGPLAVTTMIKKNRDGGATIGIGTDSDYDEYSVAAVYKWQSGDAGLKYAYLINNTKNAGSNPYKSKVSSLTAYGRQKAGKIFAEAELEYYTGDAAKYELSGFQDMKVDNALAFFAHANVDLTPVKIGALFVYIKGDDPSTTDKVEGTVRSNLGLYTDVSFNPCLILWDNDYKTWVGYTGSLTNAVSLGTTLDNVWMYNIYGSFNVTPKLNIGASYTYAYADEKPSAAYVSDKIGHEVDVTMKYKIYDNLEYMIGAGYLFTGDYFKATNANTKLSDNYLITHKLTLNF